jgi:DNA-binding NtrC family response regulator
MMELMSPAQALNTRPATGKKSVLVVDDETGIREFLGMYLTSKDFKVFTADSADAARAIWKEQQGAIDLLITDVIMPGLNGKVLAEQLAREKPSLCIIFMSGYLPEEIAVESLQHAFFKKPFHPSELLEKIREVLH